MINNGKKIDTETLVHEKLQSDILSSEKKWRTLFQILPAGVTVLNSKGMISDMNARIQEILGITKEGLLAGDYKNRVYLRPDGSVMPPEEFPSARAIKEQRVVRNVEIGVVKEDGSTVWTDVSAAPLSLPDAVCVIVTTDITDRKKMEEKFKASFSDLERINKLMVGRELKMAELKEEVERLKKQGGKN